MTVSQVLSLATATEKIELILVSYAGTLHIDQQIIKGVKSDAAITAHNSKPVSHYTYFPDSGKYNIVSVT